LSCPELAQVGVKQDTGSGCHPPKHPSALRGEKTNPATPCALIMVRPAARAQGKN